MRTVTVAFEANVDSNEEARRFVERLKPQVRDARVGVDNLRFVDSKQAEKLEFATYGEFEEYVRQQGYRKQ